MLQAECQHTSWSGNTHLAHKPYSSWHRNQVLATTVSFQVKRVLHRPAKWEWEYKYTTIRWKERQGNTQQWGLFLPYLVPKPTNPKVQLLAKKHGMHTYSHASTQKVICNSQQTRKDWQKQFERRASNSIPEKTKRPSNGNN